MSVLIGHASIDENGRAYGGQAGDQTGREVCTRSWYNRPWTVLLRPKSATVAEAMAEFCEGVCDNQNVGYDQYQRNTLRTAARAAGWDPSIIGPCETDCSAFMTVCAEAAGVDVDGCYTSGNAPVTQTMRSKFVGTGAFDALTDSKYLTTDAYLRRGDILVYEPGHTVMVLSNGDLAVPDPEPEQEDDDMLTYEQFTEYMERYRKDLQAKEGSAYSEAARTWATENGIFRGGLDGSMMWQDTLSREQLATVLYRLAHSDDGK